MNRIKQTSLLNQVGDDNGVMVHAAKLVTTTKQPSITASISHLIPSPQRPNIFLNPNASQDDIRIIEKCQLKSGDRVVWMSDDGPEFGEVRWIGFLPDYFGPRVHDRLTVGVAFDRPIGTGTGRYQSQTLFEAPRGRFIKFKDFCIFAILFKYTGLWLSIVTFCCSFFFVSIFKRKLYESKIVLNATVNYRVSVCVCVSRTEPSK